MRATIIVHGGAGSGQYRKDDPRFIELVRAVEEGMAAMRKGSSLDGVEAATRHMEGSGKFNSGKGACLTADGTVELDAAVMAGEGRVGAGVGSVTCTYHPVTLARWVAEETGHVLLVGEKCRTYAKAAGLAVNELEPSPAAERKFRLLSKRGGSAKGNLGLWRSLQEGNTVGAVAIDADGTPAGAVSTGGVWLKLPGRVGDSAVIGAGVYADSKLGAACATGIGEEIIRNSLCLRACEIMGSRKAQEAASKAIGLMTRKSGKGTAGIITVDAKGNLGSAINTDAMGRAWFDVARGRTQTAC